MELVLGSWNVTWEAAFGIRPSSCWDLCWSCICIYVSFGMRNKCPRSDYSALFFPRWLIEMAEGLIWLQAFSEGFWQHLTAFACYVKLTKTHIFGRGSYTSVFSSLWGYGLCHEVISNILYDLPGAGSELRFLPVQYGVFIIPVLATDVTKWHVWVMVFQSFASEGFCWLLWETFCSLPLGLYPFHWARYDVCWELQVPVL